jgi:hypothetical protein
MNWTLPSLKRTHYRSSHSVITTSTQTDTDPYKWNRPVSGCLNPQPTMSPDQPLF